MLHQKVKRLALIFVSTSTLLAVPAVLAAQEAPVEATTDSSGLTVLAFVLGVAGILAVGVRWLVHDSYQPEDE